MYVAWAAPGVDRRGLGGVTLVSMKYSAALQSGNVSLGFDDTTARSMSRAGTRTRVARAPLKLIVELAPGERDPWADGVGTDTVPSGLTVNVGVAFGAAATGAM